MPRLSPSVVALLIPLVLTGCKPSPTATPGITILEGKPAGALELSVRVKRWVCEISEADGTEDDDLVVPMNRAVHMTFTDIDRVAELDVALSNAQVHVARGKSAELAFRIDQPGNYTLQCPTQQPDHGPSGTAHPITALAPADYDANRTAYRAEIAPTTPEGKLELGKKLLVKMGCTSCHNADGTAKIGGQWAGLWGQQIELASGESREVNEAYVRQAILTPAAAARRGVSLAMPAFEGQIKPADLDALVLGVESVMKLPAGSR